VSDDLARISARQERQRAAAEEAWPKFLAGLSASERQVLETWSLDAEVSRTCGVEHDAAEDAHEAFDVASVVDRPIDLLRQVFDLSESQAEKVWAWHASRVTRAEEMARSVQLRRIVGVLMIPRKDVTAVIIGLALAAGGLGEMSINGFSSGASAARRLGKHRATLSHWKRFWQDLLDLKDETYGKTDEAKAKYRRARINYLEKRRRKTHEAT
jgi:hypothetical protein